MAKNNKNDKLWIDCVAGSQLRDTQGEILSVEGADISALERGEGRWNDNHGKGFFNSIGRITEAKKIFSKDDCENERHEYFWEKIKAPYIYTKGYLYNDEDHPNARAAAAILRSIHKSDAPLKLKSSVEGGVVQRGLKDPSLLAKTKIHSVAITFTPANNATLVEPLNLEKCAYNIEEDNALIKSVMPMAQERVPSFIDISERLSLEKIAKSVQTIKNMVAAARTAENKEELKKNLNALKNLAVTVAMLQGAHQMTADQGQAKDIDRQPAQQKEQQIEQPKVEEFRDAAGVDITRGSKSPYTMKPHELVSHIKTDHPHLWAIAQNESSGGKDLSHEKVGQGMHKGHSAGGAWAIMPKTVKFVVDRLDKDGHIKDVYPQLKAYTDDVDKYHKDITWTLNNSPMLSFKIASKLYEHLHNAHEGDPNKVAHSWYHGLQGTKKAAKRHGEDHVNNHPYVRKFIRHLNKLDKALTAGYGGAGAPTNLTGGGVLQSEKVLGGTTKKGEFQYITCNNCGTEQVHHANQVKCRDCGKSFSLDQLFKLIGISE